MSAPARQVDYPVELQREVDAYLEQLRFSEEPTTAGLPNVPLQVVLLGGYDGVPVSFLGNVEVSLDIELAMAMAPGPALFERAEIRRQRSE